MLSFCFRSEDYLIITASPNLKPFIYVLNKFLASGQPSITGLHLAKRGRTKGASFTGLEGGPKVGVLKVVIWEDITVS